MSTSARERDHPAATGDYERRLREMNDALLVASVHQQERTEQAERAAAALRRTEKKLRAYQQRLRGLVKELGRVEIRERRRIAVELHDNLAQLLALCKMKVSAIEAAAPAGSPIARDALAVKQLLGDGIDYTRTLMSDLRPDVLNEYDLAAAVRWVGQRMGRYGLVVRVDDDGRPKPLDEELVALLFDCARELLFNVVKHAATNKATVSLCRSRAEVRVTVSDAGVGFDPTRRTEGLSEQRGFGLFSISERLGMLGGRTEVESVPGHGARISLIVPIRCQSNNGAAHSDRRPARPAGRAGRKGSG